MRNEHNPHIQTVNPKTTWWTEHCFNFVAWLFGYDWFNVCCLLFVLLVRYRTLHEACRHVLFPDPHYGNKESKERFKQLNPRGESNNRNPKNQSPSRALLNSHVTPLSINQTSKQLSNKTSKTPLWHTFTLCSYCCHTTKYTKTHNWKGSRQWIAVSWIVMTLWY